MFDSYSPQSFSLPDSIIYSVTKNPSNPNGYQKLIETCKYFFAKNPILVFHCLRYYEFEWQICLNHNINCPKIDCKKYNYFKNTVAKIWITNSLIIDAVYTNIASPIISKIFKHEILNLFLKHQVISIDELLIFKSVKSLLLCNTNILSKSGSTLPVEKILEHFPIIDTFGHDSSEIPQCFTKNTVKELSKNLCKVECFILIHIPEVFDFEDFYEYLKKNKLTRIILYFSFSISEEYKNRLEKIVDEILQNDSPDYKIPYIRYRRMDDKKEKALYRRCR